ncbi:MAG: SGNH hydrolase domain-containing protein [Candidatus Limnocylindrales bacterium]
MRAVAVMLVLLYHASIPGVHGGYVGVDVFFVLSGFLITGLLIRELTSTGRISLPAFYARRARRLLPASAVCLLVTAVASAIILPPLRMPDVAGDIAAAAAYLSNMRFAVQATDYLASELAPSPVLHFWSLGVEEQFYVFWPAMLGILAGAAFAVGDVARGVRRVTVVLAVVFVASLALGIWLTGVQQPWAFFSLPTRAWELALGGLLAVPSAARWIPPRLAPWLAWTGLALVLLAGLRFNATTPFPGVAALVPTVGSALVIAAGLGPVVARTQPGGLPSPAGILSLPPVRFMGRISYSLYLWHWPILVLPVVAFGNLPGVARVALAGLSILVATASQRWIEEPIRHGRFVGLRPARVLALAGVTTVVVFASALGIGMASTAGLRPTGPDAGGTVDEVPLPSASAVPTGGPTPSLPAGASPAPTVAPTRPPLAHGPVPADLVPALAAARDDLPVIYSDGCHLQTEGSALGTCAYGDTASATTVVLFGDSHAAQWFPALLRLSDEHGWRLVSLTKSACSSADIRAWSSIFNRPYTECDDWREQVFQRIAAEHPALVVLSNSSGYQLTIDGAPSPAAQHPDLWAEGLARTIARLKASADQVVLMGDTVRMADDPPICLSQHLDDLAACATPYERAVGTARLRLDGGVAAAAGITFIDPTPWQCVTAECPPVIGRLLVYRDKHHMTATYARALASRLYDALPAGPAKATN